MTNSTTEGAAFALTSDVQRLSSTAMASVLSRALTERLAAACDDVVVFYDLSKLQRRLQALTNAFPRTTLHAVAVKANPTLEILRRIRTAGHGAEVASMGELELALAAGFSPDAIVFDSPAKTRTELETALRLGVRVNANSLNELTRIDSLYENLESRSQVGVRINPETGIGTIDSTSVAIHQSKFGVSLRENWEALCSAFSRYKWLKGLHLHIGSQGMSREQLLRGVHAVYELFIEVKKSAKIEVFNVGGGLPAKYRDADDPTDFGEYASRLKEQCPALFESGISLITEFGRSLHASCGWVASKIEYVIEHDNHAATLVVHVGADMFLRKAYRPADWHHDLSVCDSSGRPRLGNERTFSVAGPLCFAGDYLSRNALLPANTSEGDFLIIHDAGAYTFGMWSMYNSRQFPAIIGYRDDGEDFQCLRPRQSLNDLVQFWSNGERLA